MVFIKDAPELRFVRINAAGERMLGLPRSELIGKSDYDFFPKDQADFFVKMDRQVLEQGELLDIPEEPIETRDRGTRYLHTRKIPLLDANGRPRYLLGISEDITERKQAEVELAALLEAERRAHAEAEEARHRVSQLLALTDVALAHQGLEVLLDELLDRVRQFLGVDTAVILLLDDDGRALRPRAAKGLEEEVEQGLTVPLGQGFAGRVAAKRKPVVIGDVEHSKVTHALLRKKGIRSLLGVPLVTENGAIGVLHVGSLERRGFQPADVQLLQLVAARAALAIERARLFEAEQAAHAAAEAAKLEADQANRAKSEFLSRMSHELRTPLNAILGFGQLLERGGQLEERERDDVHHILKAGRHLLELINEVLEISRIETGELSLSPEPVAVAETVQEAVALVAPLAAERGVQLGVDLGALGDDGHVRADRQRLRQVLLNLLSNAIKYNRAKGRVDVAFEADGDRLRILIADTGIGISPERLDSAFEPFERLGAEHSEVEGTGLGLALSKRLVEAMGGTIAVDSDPARGTTFAVELHAVEHPQSAVPAEAEPLAAAIGEALGSQRRILYIEDNVSNLTLVERILSEQSGLELVAAMQGQLGLDLARQHRPDLIVLDLHLPDMTGEEVLRRLKADPSTREIPVVVLSADASKGQVDRLTREGADDYLTKPLDVTRFLGVLADKLG